MDVGRVGKWPYQTTVNVTQVNNFYSREEKCDVVTRQIVYQTKCKHTKIINYENVWY